MMRRRMGVTGLRCGSKGSLQVFVLVARMVGFGLVFGDGDLDLIFAA